MQANFSRVIDSKKAEILVAEENNQVVGFVLISKSKSDDIHDFDFYGEMNYMYIKSEFRGRGIASKFFKEAKKWFKKHGLKYLKLDVNINNRKARKIYEGWGFNNYEIGMWSKLR